MRADRLSYIIDVDQIDPHHHRHPASVSTPASSNPRHPVRTTGHWFGPLRRPLLGWLSEPDPRGTRSGVVVLAPVGYAYWCSHRTLRVLAERIASQGHRVLRFDYDGLGDSAGSQWDADRLAAWRTSAQAAVAEMRRLGCTQVTLIGVRLGATLALLDRATLGADRVVAWAPVIKGRRYAKELRMLSSEVPAEADPAEPKGTLVEAGNVFTPQTVADLAQLTLEQLESPAAAETLIVDDPAGAAQDAQRQLEAVGGRVRRTELAGGELALATPPEFAQPPDEILNEICGWVGASPASEAPPAPAQLDAEFPWRGAPIVEEVVTLEPHGHVGVLCSPPEVAANRSTLVLLNPGSETHVGPGRAWVELARELALLGYRTLRIDFRGWGESPDDGRAPGRPYDLSGVEDARVIADQLHAAGHDRVVLFGLCASAWIALRAALDASADGVIALNPQMYWQPGDPVEIDWDQIRARRAGEIRRIAIGDRCRAWTALDVLGLRPPAGTWLDQLEATGLPIKLLFAEGDDGLLFLAQRLSRRLNRVQRGGTVTVRELPGVDHPLHRVWMRPGVVAAIHEALEEIDAAGSGSA